MATTAITNNHCSTMSTASSTSSYYSPLAGKIPTSPGCSAISVKVAKLIDHTNTWKIVPQWYMDQRPQNPASVYGAVHLARLFGEFYKNKSFFFCKILILPPFTLI